MTESLIKKFLLTSAQKQVVGIALTPGIGLEAAIYDRNKNIVVKYGSKKVAYNFSTREIEDYIEFKSALSELMQELNIPAKATAYLILPNVYFNFLEIPPSITDEEINTALLSRVEEFYLFKKEEPISGWCNVVNINDTSQRRLAYSAFQKNAIESITQIFSELSLKLIGIETAYSATIRGLYSLGLIDDVIARKESWTAMIVNTNSFTMLYFDAENLIECAEVPIAIKSFSPEEAYSSIATSASQMLENFYASKLYIISQTDDICAEILENQIRFEKETVTIDSNKYSQKPLVEIRESSDFNKSNAMTLSVIGASNIKTDLGLIINTLSNDPSSYLNVYFTKTIGDTTIDVTSELIMKLSFILIGICAAIFGLLYGGCYALNTWIENNVSDLSSQISNLDSAIAAESNQEVGQEFDMNKIIDEVAQTNVKTIKYYDSISNDIPKNIWLTQYYNTSGDKVVIKGIAENITDIYEYYKNLKIASPESDIKLTELKVLTQDQNNESAFNGLYINPETSRLYGFEISNTVINANILQQATGAGAHAATNETDIIIKTTGGGPEQMSQQARPIN